MKPAARLQGVIELLDAIIEAVRSNGPAANVLIKRYFATRRYATFPHDRTMAVRR